mmetsp:Transcript_12160/g.27696  ORF Transcript_12160/g.27696 Transcript_12160/m.27696 type:complete len:356 (-) Transcript_12160:60-1127(-)
MVVQNQLVAALGTRHTTTDDVQHVLRNVVDLVAVVLVAHGLEVLLQHIAGLAKVHKVSTARFHVSREQHNAVVEGKDFARRLVDGGQHRPSLLRKLLHRAHHIQRRRRVQTRGGLVQEQNTWVVQETQANGNTLGLTATHASHHRASDLRVLTLGQAHLANDLVHAGSLLLPRELAVHLQQRRVHQHLAHRESAPKGVLLLHVARVAPNLAVRWLVAVEENETLDDAHGLPLTDDVHQRTLSGATRAHQGNHVAGVERSGERLEAAQQVPLFALAEGDLVGQVVEGNLDAGLLRLAERLGPEALRLGEVDLKRGRVVVGSRERHLDVFTGWTGHGERMRRALRLVRRSVRSSRAS